MQYNDEDKRFFIVFPTNPDDNQYYSDGRYTWKYSDIFETWEIVADGTKELVAKTDSSKTKYVNNLFVFWLFVFAFIVTIAVSASFRSGIYSYNVNNEISRVDDITKELNLTGTESLACFRIHTNDEINDLTEYSSESKGRIIECADMAKRWSSILAQRQAAETAKARASNVTGDKND